ncbi:GlcG/HbpS family heme-binding protein [Nocardioides ferulae]|uniref:GlcG/HbpS family heme-binding protein n=1 Tax=Nocardioides ferulae TaxID=2340821 RepID=UPI001F0C3D0D|nr:heme-binding protein [Nocardioides ferulae]
MSHLRPALALTHVGARAALDAALAYAASLGVPVNVAVTDAGGALLAFARMDGAFAASADIAIDKARTVAGFGGAPTDELYAAIESEPAVRDGIAGRPGVAAFGGGVPVVVDGEPVGAIGVSGGSAAQDRAVAEAGARAVAPTPNPTPREDTT